MYERVKYGMNTFCLSMTATIVFLNYTVKGRWIDEIVGTNWKNVPKTREQINQTWP